MNRIILFAVLSAFLFTGFQFNNKQQNKLKRNRDGRMIQKLNLSDDQKEKINAMRFEREEMEIDLEAELKMNKLNIQKLLEKDNFSKGDFLDLVENGSKLRSELMKLKAEFWLDVRDILNPEQKELWKMNFPKMGNKGKRFRDNDKRRFFRERFNGRKMNYGPYFKRGISTLEQE